MSTLPRMIKMLECIPRYPRKISSSQLSQTLMNYGYRVDIRTIQRDLDELSRHFPLIKDERSKPYGWSFSEDLSLSLPRMDIPTALAFIQARELLGKAMPGSLLQSIQPYMEAAQNILKDAPNPQIKDWTDKVRILPDWLPLIPASYSEDILQEVTEAIFQGKMVNIDYRRKGPIKSGLPQS